MGIGPRDEPVGADRRQRLRRTGWPWSRRRVRFVMMATPMPTPRHPTNIEDVLRRAEAAERSGFDVVSVADWAVSDPFPLLTLLAQRTERVDLITRVIANATRSPLLLASAAVWIDTISNGRFVLGLGASIPNIVEGRHGFPFDRPATRMRDSLTIIRSLMGDELPGVMRNADGSIRYAGQAIRVERGRDRSSPASNADRHRSRGGLGCSRSPECWPTESSLR
ncbi:MAG: hypothetical protein KatS3mg060_1768 [Dehalococcoidia bacterium]|nr:MAG: hypothetical protein KatS3mg060_1768 [Dehalococcoidia bacterium]